MQPFPAVKNPSPRISPGYFTQGSKKSDKNPGIKQPILFSFDVREFPKFRQEILDTLIRLRNKIQPDIVFTPSRSDTHQDHKTTVEETMRAFKKCSILGYEQPWNNITFNTHAFVPLKESHVQKKIDALACYETQKDRAYFNPDFIRGLALTRGTQIEQMYAEAFDVIKWVI